MDRARESSIGRPAIADKNPGKVGTEHGGGFLKAAAGLNGVRRRVGGGIRPQPLQPRGHFPAGFVGRDDGTATNGFAERRIGRFGPSRRSAHCVHEPAASDRQREPLTEQRGDLAERQAQLLIEDHGQRDGSGPELRGGRAEGVRCLQGMPTLDPAAAGGAVANRDVKGPDNGAHHWEIFVILGRVASQRERVAARGTRQRQWRLMRLRNVGGYPAMGALAVSRSCFASPAPGTASGDAARERCRLAMQADRVADDTGCDPDPRVRIRGAAARSRAAVARALGSGLRATPYATALARVGYATIRSGVQAETAALAPLIRRVGQHHPLNRHIKSSFDETHL